MSSSRLCQAGHAIYLYPHKLFKSYVSSKGMKKKKKNKKKMSDRQLAIESLRWTLMALGVSFALSAVPIALEALNWPKIKMLFEIVLMIIYILGGGFIVCIASRFPKSE